MSGEDTYIKAIRGGMIAIKNGTKLPKDANVGKNLKRLKDVNEGMYEEMLEEYKKVMDDFYKK